MDLFILLENQSLSLTGKNICTVCLGFNTECITLMHDTIWILSSKTESVPLKYNV